VEGARERPARVVIADDHDLVREGLRARLATQPKIEIVGEAENGREAVEICYDLLPDLVLMDVRMPELDGLAATRKIKERLPRTSVVMVTMHDDPDYLMEAIQAGAAGYVLKGAKKQELIEAIERVLAGESLLDQGLAMRLLQRLVGERGPVGPTARREGRPPAPLREPLTDREIEVLRLMAQGQTNPVIARNLLVSVGTVKAHVQHIIAKMGVSDRTQASVRAAELGLLSSE
jgi:two-component system, NarL family, response regulator LiaR